MKTQVTLTIDADLKEKFQKIAKKLGSNMSALTNMYYAQVVQTGRVEYHLDAPVEIWSVLESDLTQYDRDAIERIKKADPSTFLNI